jgi:hypothetical protein
MDIIQKRIMVYARTSYNRAVYACREKNPLPLSAISRKLPQEWYSVKTKKNNLSAKPNRTFSSIRLCGKKFSNSSDFSALESKRRCPVSSFLHLFLNSDIFDSPMKAVLSIIGKRGASAKTGKTVYLCPLSCLLGYSPRRISGTIVFPLVISFPHRQIWALSGRIRPVSPRLKTPLRWCRAFCIPI